MLLVAALLGAVVWAVLRHRNARKNWRASALQANADGTALHDAAVGELISAGTANRPERWESITEAGNALAASLASLEAAPPSEAARQAATGVSEAVTGLRAALTIASAAPAGTPLDEAARDTLRERLQELAAALQELKTAAGSG